MPSRVTFAILGAALLLAGVTAAHDRWERDDRRDEDGRGGPRWHRGGFRPGVCWTPGINFGVTYSSPVIVGAPGFFGAPPAYYDPFLAEQNQAIFEFQRQQARRDAERVLQAEAEARAAAAERLAALKAETRKKRAAAAAKTGARHFTAGNYRNAASNYHEAASLASDDASVYLMLAQAQFAMKRFFEAAQTLRTAVRANPKLVDSDVLGFYKNADEFKEQLAALADELRSNPLNRDAMFLLGHMLFVSGQKAKARTILLECARLGVEDDVLRPYLDYFPAAVDSATGLRPR